MSQWPQPCSRGLALGLYPRSTVICSRVPYNPLHLGLKTSMPSTLERSWHQREAEPTDGQNLLFGREEGEAFLARNPDCVDPLRKYIGADEFIKGNYRYCLWLKNSPPDAICQQQGDNGQAGCREGDEAQKQDGFCQEGCRHAFPVHPRFVSPHRLPAFPKAFDGATDLSSYWLRVCGRHSKRCRLLYPQCRSISIRDSVIPFPQRLDEWSAGV